MGRSPLYEKEGLNKGAWTAMEDKILTEYIKIHGEGKWGSLPKKAGLRRCGKSCRLRWLNYLRPDIKRGNITHDEEELIIRLHKLLGNRWSLIAGRLPGRTDNEIKNYWNTKIGKKFQNRQNQDQFPSSSKSSSLDQLCQEKNVSSTAQKHLAQPSPVINTNASTVGCTKASKCDLLTAIPNDPIINSDHNRQLQIINEPQPLVKEDAPDFSDLTRGGDFEIDDKFLSDLLSNSNFSELINFDVCDKDPNVLLNSNEALVIPNDTSNDSYFPLLGCLMEPSEFDWLQG